MYNGSTRGKEREKEETRIFEEIMSLKSLKLNKNMKPLNRNQNVSSKKNPENHHVKSQKQSGNLEERQDMYTRSSVRLTANLSSKTMDT